MSSERGQTNRNAIIQIYYKYHGVVKKVQVKDESKNISGSIKDRPARMIIEDALSKRTHSSRYNHL